MKVHTLAGSRRLNEPARVAPPAPQFRWTFKTWIRKSWRATDYSHYGSREVDKFDNLSECTMTVIAGTEDEAKRKIEAALPPTPANQRVEWESRDRVTFERRWQLEGEVVEVMP